MRAWWLCKEILSMVFCGDGRIRCISKPCGKKKKKTEERGWATVRASRKKMRRLDNKKAAVGEGEAPRGVGVGEGGALARVGGGQADEAGAAEGRGAATWAPGEGGADSPEAGADLAGEQGHGEEAVREA